MSIWSRLLGSSKVVESGLDLIDNAFYTDQEKADQKRLLLKAYEPFKVAQRLLAVMFTSVFLLLVLVNIALSFWFDVSQQMAFVDEYLSLPMTLIVGFYFAGGAVEGVAEILKKT